MTLLDIHPTPIDFNLKKQKKNKSSFLPKKSFILPFFRLFIKMSIWSLIPFFGGGTNSPAKEMAGGATRLGLVLVNILGQ